MSDHSTPPAALESEGTSNYTPKSFDIAPEDAALAESIVNQHPGYDLSGPVSVVGAVKLPNEITRETLPPDVRAQVELRLNAIPEGSRAAAEAKVIREEAENYAYAVCVWGGPGPDANAYQQERFLVEHEIWEAQSRLSERLSALADIVSHDRKTDPETGEVYDEPVYRVQGDARTAAEYEASDLKQRIALLRGSEGARRLAKAKFEAVETAKKLRDEVAIDREAQARAKSEAREARLAERTAAYRKFEDTER